MRRFQLAVRIKVIAYDLVDYPFIMLDELVPRHPGGLPQGLKASVPVKPFVSGLMVDLMPPRVL